jgi:excinuclease UvrABC helicase subunit UvrB
MVIPGVKNAPFRYAEFESETLKLILVVATPVVGDRQNRMLIASAALISRLA